MRNGQQSGHVSQINPFVFMKLMRSLIDEKAMSRQIRRQSVNTSSGRSISQRSERQKKVSAFDAGELWFYLKLLKIHTSFHDTQNILKYSMICAHDTSRYIYVVM